MATQISGSQSNPAVSGTSPGLAGQAESAAAKGATERLTGTPDLVDRLVPRQVATETTAQTLSTYQSPLDHLMNSSGLVRAAASTATELSSGSNGPAVGQLQQKLTDLGYNPGTVDNDFGPKTAAALGEFQQDRIDSLQATLAGGPPPIARATLNNQVAQLTLEKSRGVAGAMTLQQLGLDGADPINVEQPVQTPAPVEPAEQTPTGLSVGQSGVDVRNLQRNLQRAGFSPGTIDSDFGQRTLAAVQDFQSDRINTIDQTLSGNIPPIDREYLQGVRTELQSEYDSQVAGVQTLRQLEAVVAANTPDDLPVNTNLTVDSNGFVSNDPRIVLNRVPELEQSAFSDPVGDIDNVILHRTVTDTAEATITSFETPRNGTHFGTHFLIGRDGTIQQTASLNNITYHAGNSNRSSVGIEVVGMPLDQDGNPTVGPPNGNPVVGWEELTPEQVEATAYLTNTLNAYYGLGADSVQAHEEVAAKTAGEGGTVYNAIEGLLIE